MDCISLVLRIRSSSACKVDLGARQLRTERGRYLVPFPPSDHTTDLVIMRMTIEDTRNMH